MNFMGVRQADPGGQKNKVGDQKNKVVGQKNKFRWSQKAVENNTKNKVRGLKIQVVQINKVGGQ